jgi:acyl-CoA thioester hydrolase
VLEVQMRFSRELRNRQRIRIVTWMESYAGKVGKLVQRIQDHAGTVYAEATFTIGLFDLDARRLIRPTPEWLEALGLKAGDVG